MNTSAAPSEIASLASAFGLFRAMGWVLLLIVVGVVGFLLAMWLRRWIMGSPDPTPEEPAGFAIGDLRRLRDQGKLSTEEYEKARAKLLESAKGRHLAGIEPAPGARPQPKDVDLIREVE